MVPFHLDVQFKNQAVGLEVEQLDYINHEGYIRFDVRTEDRRAVLSIPMADQVNPEDISFEAVQVVDEGFSDEEMIIIMNAIRDYNQLLRVRFTGFMSRN